MLARSATPDWIPRRLGTMSDVAEIYDADSVATFLKIAGIESMSPTSFFGVRTDTKDYAPSVAKFVHREQGYAGPGFYAVASAQAWKVWLRKYQNGEVE